MTHGIHGHLLPQGYHYMGLWHFNALEHFHGLLVLENTIMCRGHFHGSQNFQGLLVHREQRYVVADNSFLRKFGGLAVKSQLTNPRVELIVQLIDMNT